MTGLRIQGLVKRYPGHDRVVAVDHVDLAVETGELLVLLGPSGCGKTTLLRCVAGLEAAQAGTIELGGTRVFDAGARFNLPTYRRDIGMVFQNYSLWPHMTVRRNVEYPLRARGLPRAERDARAEEALRIVQCAHLAQRLPAMLSGGQQQRIALARALAPQPAVMLLDEPLSNLDAVLRVDLRAQLRAIHRSLGFTGIYVTHDQAEAFNLGSRVAVMRAGRIEQIGSARDVYQRPATEYVATFLGIRNVLTLTRTGGWSSPAGAVGGDLSVLGERPGPLHLYVRPEALQLRAPATGAPTVGTLTLPSGRIQDMLYGGGEVDYVIEAGSAVLYARVPATAASFQPGDTVALGIARGDALLYADDRLIGA